jgi:hypothetical protein
VLTESFLEIACERLGQDVAAYKKKAATKRSIEPTRRGKAQ